MMRRLFRAIALTLTLAFGLPLDAADEAKKDDKKPAKLVATDPDKAGPDFAIQGEYRGTIGNDTFGAEVIAKGNGTFVINFLPGGLRGEGGDFAKRIEGSAKTEGDRTVLSSKDGKWTGALLKGKLTGKTGDNKEFTFDHVVRKSKTLGEKPPSGAVVLFDGKLDEWPSGKLADGNLLGSDIDSKTAFGDHKLHLEFRLSFMPNDGGQGRSNSGVYPQHRYEVQVLDSFGLKGENNECGGIYSQHKPLVNMCYPPLQWQTYDIEFTAAKFKDGKKVSNARMTVYHNGVMIHDNVQIEKPTGGGRDENEKPGTLHLQGHGGQVQYRNIWVVEKK